MVGTGLKAETMNLVEKRGAVEAEMNAIIRRLCQPGGPGLYGNLLDSEGFPRADIDIPTIRVDRRRLTELKTDHKDLTEKINQNIQLLHAAQSTPKTLVFMDSENCKETDSQVSDTFNGCPSVSPAHDCLRNAASASSRDVVVQIPFAVVDEIAEASPAAEDGLQLGDQIVKFGNVKSGADLLSRLASEVQAKQGGAVTVVVMRQGALVNLSLTPRTWQGRGLLGCHFRIL